MFELIGAPPCRIHRMFWKIAPQFYFCEGEVKRDESTLFHHYVSRNAGDAPSLCQR
jgi:hypothetical protein